MVNLKIVFTDQYANVLFLVNGLAILFFLAAKKKKKQRAMKFGNYETLQKVAGKNFLKSSNILLLTKIAALTALIIGISSPVVVSEIESTNSDYVIAIDSSSSMLASDLNPTRFEAAKDVSNDFVSRLSNDTKAGVVSFAGEVRRESPLTSDKTETKGAIDRIDTGSTAGTAIGDALYTSASILIGSNRSKEVILITDGRNNAGSPMNESLQYVKSHNVSVTAIGIGKEQEVKDRYETVSGVNASRARFPNIDVESLNRTARETGGKLVTVTNSSGLRSAVLDFEKVKARTDISIYFILLALVLILTEWVLGTTRYSILP